MAEKERCTRCNIFRLFQSKAGSIHQVIEHMYPWYSVGCNVFKCWRAGPGLPSPMPGSPSSGHYLILSRWNLGWNCVCLLRTCCICFTYQGNNCSVVSQYHLRELIVFTATNPWCSETMNKVCMLWQWPDLQYDRVNETQPKPKRADVFPMEVGKEDRSLLPHSINK